MRIRRDAIRNSRAWRGVSWKEDKECGSAVQNRIRKGVIAAMSPAVEREFAVSVSVITGKWENYQRAFFPMM